MHSLRSFLFFLFAASALPVSAQEVGKAWRFRVVKSIPGAETTDDSCVLHLFSGKHVVMRATWEDSDGVLLVDSSAHKVMLVDDPDGEAEIYPLEYGTFRMEDAFNLLPDSVGFRLLPETKELFGIACRRVELLYEGAVSGTGWIAPGLQIPGMNNHFTTPAGGQLLGFELRTPIHRYTLELLEYDSDAVLPKNAYAQAWAKSREGCIVKD